MWIIPGLFCGWVAGAFAVEAGGGASIDDIIGQLAAHQAERPEEGELRRAALQGILEFLQQEMGDPAACLLTETEYQNALGAARGDRFGVGIGVLIVPEYGIRIMEVFPGTPAAEAGLAPGAVITGIDSVELKGRGTQEIQALLGRHVEGVASFDVMGDGVPRRVRLQPVRYRVPAVSSSQVEATRVVRVHHFGPDFVSGLNRALASVPRGAPLVIDLRDTSGGTKSQVLEGALRLTGPGTAWQGTVTLVVNAGTRGLGELFAGTLRQGLQNARLLGTSTAGVASVPAYYRVSPDLVLEYSGERLFLQDGTTWERIGLLLDVVVHPFVGLAMLPPPSPVPDLQVDAAIQLVRGP